MPYVKIEPSGCCERHGLAQVRLAMYLEPTDYAYEKHYVQVCSRELTEAEIADPELAKLVPKVWQLNPFHSHFLHLEPNVTDKEIEDLMAFHLPNFYEAWCQDYSDVKGGMRHGWDVKHRTRPKRYEKLITPQEYLERKSLCLSRLQGIKSNPTLIRPDKSGELFPSTDIDVGAGAVYSVSNWTTYDYTLIDLNNAANDTGSIDTFEFYYIYSCTTVTAGTFQRNGVSIKFTSRDSEYIGAVTGGSKQSFDGLDCDITLGDWMGIHSTDGKIERFTSGYGGTYYKLNSQFGTGEQSYAVSAGDALSIYGTGSTPVVAPTVTTQAATDKEDTTATGNGNITVTGGANCDKRGIVWDLATQGDPGNTAPGVSDYANDVVEEGDFGTGAFTRSLTSLPTGDTIYARAYAHNSEGYAYGAEVNWLTKPAKPTNVAATENASDKVVITWTKSTGATDYHAWRDAVDLGAAGDVATVDDSGAAASLITAGSVVATDGSETAHVALSLSGTSVANGTTHTYKVVASNATGDSDDSDTDTGYRLASAITYQWNRSSGDADADYGVIGGATSSTHNDTAAPAGTISNAGTVTASDGTEAAYVTLSLASEATTDGAARYFTCTLVSTNASNTPQTATANRGYRTVGAITFQWQMSDADSDAAYNTNVGTTDPRNATEAPANGDGRYFQCVLSSTDASNSPQTSDNDRGYRDTFWGGTICGVSTPAAVNGVAVANIAKVIGVE